MKIIENEEIDKMELVKKQSNETEIIVFLKEYTNLTEKQINNRLKIINK